MDNKMKKFDVFKLIIRVVILLVLLTIIYIGYIMIVKVNGMRDIFENLDETEASLTEYIVYGTHLNLKGNIQTENTNIENVSLSLRNINGEDKIINLDYKNTSNGIEFYTSELINEGIYLESIDINTYYIFVKVQYNDGSYKEYTIRNTTDYDSVEYYTLTKDNKNNKINIKFGKHNTSKKEIAYMCMEVKQTKIPDDVYDIVIDPGHRRSRCRCRIRRI